MRKTFLVIFTATMFLVAVRTVRASHQSLSWSVQWGNEEYPGSYWTYWKAKASPDKKIKLSTYYLYKSSTSGEVNITEDGVSKTFSANPSHFSAVEGFNLSELGADHAFSGSFWNHNACLPGPIVSLDLSQNRRIMVENTSDIVLYLTLNENKWYELSPGESWSRAVKKQGPLSIMTSPSMESPKCADVRWDMTDHFDVSE